MGTGTADVDPVTDYRLFFVTNCVGFAGFTTLVWDHIDTFTMEVEYIWKKPKGLISCLFLLNRYLTPLGFMVNLFAYLSPVWDHETCRHFIRYEGAMTLIGIDTVGIMMLVRIHALYKNQMWIVLAVGSVLALQFSINAWLLTRGIPVPHSNPDIHACTMIFDARNLGETILASSTAWLPLVYDTIVFSLTFYRTVPSMRGQSKSRIAKRLFEDGLLYYSVIFSVTLVLTLMIIFAPEGLKNVAAQLELLITVTMMSRITLNLKKFSADEKDQNQSSMTISTLLPRFFKQLKSQRTTTTLNNTYGNINIGISSSATEDVELSSLHLKSRTDDQSVFFD